MPGGSSTVDVDIKKLELLYDYTKFHIGVYLTLTAAYIGVATAFTGDGVRLLEINRILMWFAVFCFMLAGLAGGIIVSSITQTDKTSVAAFLGEDIGPWNAKRIRAAGRTWTYVEHTSFWIGLISAVLSFAVPELHDFLMQQGWLPLTQDG